MVAKHARKPTLLDEEGRHVFVATHRRVVQGRPIVVVFRVYVSALGDKDLMTKKSG